MFNSYKKVATVYVLLINTLFAVSCSHREFDGNTESLPVVNDQSETQPTYDPYYEYTGPDGRTIKMPDRGLEIYVLQDVNTSAM